MDRESKKFVRDAERALARYENNRVGALQDDLARKTSAPEYTGNATRGDVSRMYMQNRYNLAGLRAGAQESLDPKYMNSDKFAKDLKRVLSETRSGNLRGANNANPAAGAMAAAATSRALTRLIPVIGQVAGAGIAGAAVGSGLYEAADEDIQDVLARLGGMDPETGLRSEQSPGNILDMLTEKADEMVQQAREATAVTQAWERGVMPAGQKPQR